jgi:hypothetical protein
MSASEGEADEIFYPEHFRFCALNWERLGQSGPPHARHQSQTPGLYVCRVVRTQRKTSAMLGVQPVAAAAE